MTLLLLVAAALGLTPNAAGPTTISGAPVAQTLGTTTGATQADPSSILQSVTSSGGNIIAVLEDPTTTSALPYQGASWSVPARDAFGSVYGARPEDAIALRLWLGDNGLPADVIVGAALTTGPLTQTSLGIAVTLQQSSTGPRVGHSIGSGANWTNTAGTTSSAYTAGAELQLAAGPTLLAYNTHPIDPKGARLTTAITLAPASGTVSSILGPWDTLTVWAGWRTGTGGVAGSTAAFSAELMVAPASRVPSLARSAVQDSNALPISGAIPSQVTILAIGNSHIQGASSGAEDTTWRNLAVQAGVQHRHNGAAVTTWGVRPGSGPYLAQLFLNAGVAEVNYVVNAGSGRSAQGIWDNLGLAALDVYALGEGNRRPDAIMYVQSNGNISSEAQYLDFVEDFPAVLDMLDALYPGVPVFAGSGIEADDDADAQWRTEVDAAKQATCLTVSPVTGRIRCTYVNIFLADADLDGTDHPTVGAGEGTDLIARAFAAALGVP